MAIKYSSKVSRYLALVLVASLFNIVSSQSADAAPTATISGRNATLVSPSAITNLTGISVGGLAEGTTYLVAVGLSDAPTGASLKLPTYTNLNVSYGYSAPSIYNSFETVSFSGALADINNALASLQYISGSQTGSPVLKISASSYNQSYSLSGYNGHYYSSSTTLGLANATYTAARAAAKLQTYQGQPGYLVSITNSGENDFITNNIANATSIWIGATDAVTEGQWRWDTEGGSPEAGLRFFNQTGAANCGRTGGTNYTGDGLNYSSWASNEPNDYCSSGEDYAVTNWGGTGVNGGTWNDCPDNGCGAGRAYVIEFGTNAADGGFVNASSDFASNTFSLLYSSNAITTYSASSTTPTYGSAVTLTATVTSGATGTVAFKDASNNVLCTTGNLSSGSASCSWTPATRATYAVTAFYSGDGSYLASNSPSANVTVTTRPITIKASDQSATYTGTAASVSNSYSITSGTLAGSDSFTALTYTYSSAGYSASQTAPTNAGTYTITPSAASFSSGLASNYNITYETATLTIAPSLPQAPSFPQATLKVIVDNDYAIFMGDDANATRLFYQNNVDWYTQVPTAASLDITAQAGETYIYVVTMGGGGTEDFAGTLNGQDVLNIPGAQVASSRSPIGTAVVSGPYVKLESYISGYNASAVAAGTQNVTLAGLQNALTGVVWSSAVAVGAGDGNVPYYKTSGAVACGTAATTGLSGNCWGFPSNSAVVFRYPLSSLTLPVSPNVGSVTVDWTASESSTAAGDAPTGYIVQYKRTVDPDSSFTTIATTAADTTIATITGLTSGVDYSFRVAATNSTGVGSYSITKTSTPAALPVISSLSATTIATTTTFNFISDKAGTFYALVYESATAAPNATTLITQSSGSPTVAKSTSIAAYGANTFSVNGLTAGVSYKAYVIVQDSAQNTSEISVISFTVQGAFTLTSTSGIYGTTLLLTTSGGSGTGAISYSTATAGCSISNTDSLTATNAQTCSITATKAADSTYLQITSSATSVVIAARPITIKASDQSATYTGAAASISNSYSITSGTLAGSDSFTALTYTYTLAPLSYNSQTAPTNAATYIITPSAASFSVGTASNYSITYSVGALTISQADSITVTTTGATTTYAPNTPVPGSYVITGLMGDETGTVTSNYAGIGATSYGSGATCALGGTCSVGDLAPGGGYVFYVSATSINAATGISSGGIYLATAPQTWNGGAVDPVAAWGCRGQTMSGSFSSAVGFGAENTRLINAECATTGIPSRLADAATAGGFTDWFIPSADELALMYSQLKLEGLSNLNGADYWSSTQISDNSAHYQWMGGSAGPTDKINALSVRPIRAFNPTVSATSTTPPTDAGSYSLTPSSLVLANSASLDNYQGVIYESSTITINKAQQTTLSIGQYLAFPNISSYPINVNGGSGTGALTRSLLGAGSASCTLSDGLLLTATSVGTCSVQVVKALDTNYLAETATATIYWILWSNSYATQTPSTPTGIDLPHVTEIIAHDYYALTVTGYTNETGTPISSAAIGDIIRIIGTGFDNADTAMQVTFFEMINVEKSLLSVTPISIQLTVPEGAETGAIIVDLTAASTNGPSLTITP